NAVPTWNGDVAALVDWIHDMETLATISEQMSRKLAAIAPQRFRGRVRDWWSLLPPEHRRSLMQDWHTLRAAIISHFVTTRFHQELIDTYDRQRFRQKGHEKESPSDFVYRRLRHFRTLYEEGAAETKEIRAVMRNAPAMWSTILSPDSLTTIAGLLQQVNEKTPELVQVAGLL
ncbi:hypothetical protein FOMPIDRAFT_1096007, partial [Fomitopsis schrenkii]